MPTIRPSASADDVATVRRLFVEYEDSLGVKLCFQGFEDELASLPGAYAPPGGALLLAEHEGKVVGCVAVRPLDPPKIAELKRLYVRPEGRGLGAGRALTEAALSFVRAAGYESIRLDTLPEMKEAQGLYRRLGFHETAPYRHNPVEGSIYMELALR